jgi:hypothetical protein
MKYVVIDKNTFVWFIYNTKYFYKIINQYKENMLYIYN